jgi:serine/threonine protein kinase
MHNRTFIHRDIKAGNFLIGRGESQHMIYMIDFGLANRYIDSDTWQHISYRNGKKLVGTARYASINTHLGMEQSRRDDLESLGYLMIYLLNGSLPWETVVAETKEEKIKKIEDIKLNMSLQSLCKGLPEQIVTYLDYCRELQFTEKPNYAKLHKLFKDLLMKKGEFYDYKYDWTTKPEVFKVKVGVPDGILEN